jgi:hypothetical protein
LAGQSFGGEFIEELISRGENLTDILRLLCLYSLTNNGIKQKQLDNFKKEILEV